MDGVNKIRSKLAMTHKRMEEKIRRLEQEKKKQQDENRRLQAKLDEFKQQEEIMIRKEEQADLQVPVGTDCLRDGKMCKQFEEYRQRQEAELNKLQEAVTGFALDQIIHDEICKQFRNYGQKQEDEFKRFQEIVTRTSTKVVAETEDMIASSSSCSSTCRGSTMESEGKCAMCHSRCGAAKPEPKCVVCGDTANGRHYSALTCEGCKIFFRRHAKQKTNLEKCRSYAFTNKFCEMDLQTRKTCSYCRMKKCLEVGMNIERIWDEKRCKARKSIKKATGDLHLTKLEDRMSAYPPQDPPILSKPELTDTHNLQPHRLSGEHKRIMVVASGALQNARDVTFSIFKFPTPLEQAKRGGQLAATESMEESDLAETVLLRMTRVGMASVPYTPGVSSTQNEIKLEEKGEKSSSNSPVSDQEINEDMYNHIMEAVLLCLKLLINFVKALPGFPDLSFEDQAILIKEAFVEFMILQAAYAYEPKENLFRSIIVPGEVYTLSDLRTGGYSHLITLTMPLLERISQLRLTIEEQAALIAMCIFTPDRPTFSNTLKMALNTYYKQYVQALCASGEINHREMQFYPKVLEIQMELQKFTNNFMKQFMEFKLQGRIIEPVLGELMDLQD